jgi:hypothetical protein
MTSHPQVCVRVGSWVADVDAGVANDIRRLWHHGIATLYSCQGGPVPRLLQRPVLAARARLWASDRRYIWRLGNALNVFLGDAYVMVARSEDVTRARELLSPRYRIEGPPSLADRAYLDDVRHPAESPQRAAGT